MQVYQEEGLFQRALDMEKRWGDAIHSLKGLPHVIDLRNLGLIGAIELEPIAGQPTRRAMDVFQRCFDDGLLIRTTGDIVALSPPLIIEDKHIERIVDVLSRALKAAA